MGYLAPQGYGMQHCQVLLVVFRCRLLGMSADVLHWQPIQVLHFTHPRNPPKNTEAQYTKKPFKALNTPQQTQAPQKAPSALETPLIPKPYTLRGPRLELHRSWRVLGALAEGSLEMCFGFLA